MDALKAVGLCALLAAPPQAAQPCGPVVQVASPAIDRWQALIDEASARFSIPADWIAAVMARESAGLTAFHGVPIVSSAGAMGLMQLMPGTWSEMRARYKLGNDPFDPHDNIFAGAAYLREMFNRYGYPGLFAAYHDGPRRMDAFLARLESLPEGTKTYLKVIVPGREMGVISSGNRSAATANPASDSLFFVRKDASKMLSSGMTASSGAQELFLPLISSRP